MSDAVENQKETVKPRRRRPPTWEIHSASGVRIAGGEGPDWWDRARPADPEPDPVTSEAT
jgi:hypothetical protein